MFSPPPFRYLVVHKDADDRASQFSGFSWPWLRNAASIADVLRLPSTILDVIYDSERSVGVRVQGYGRHSILLVPLEQLAGLPTVPFMILVSDASTVDGVNAFLEKVPVPTLHLSDVERSNVISKSRVTIADFRNWLSDLSDYLSASSEPGAEDVAYILAEATIDQNREIIGDISANTRHELSARYALAACAVPLPPLSAPDALLSDSYHLIKERRRRLEDPRFYRPGVTQLLLNVISLPKELRASDVAASSVSQLGKSAFDQIVGGAEVSDDPVETAKRLTGSTDPDAVAICRERAMELQGLLVAMSVEATAQFVPVIEIRSVYPRVKNRVEQVLGTIRHGQPLPPETSRRFAEIGTAMANQLPREVLAEIASVTGTMKVLGDDPIELIQIDNIPLPLRCNVVRLPATPGFVLEDQLRLTESIVLAPRDFEHILVLRASSPRDEIYPVFEMFADVASKYSHIKVEIRDVRSADELIDSFRNFSGALAVFDGHGKQQKGRGGVLSIGDVEVDVWKTAAKLHVPPIVFLAACDTHPFDRREDTTAAALLTAGARAVIATSAPVGAAESTLLFGHLLYALSVLLPNCPTPVRFSELFGLALRLAYVFELTEMHWPQSKLKIDAERFRAITRQAVYLISNFDRGWLDYFLSEISKATSLLPPQVLGILSTEAGYPDALLHCQLGRPESIFLTPSDDWWDVELKRVGWPDGIGSLKI